MQSHLNIYGEKARDALLFTLLVSYFKLKKDTQLFMCGFSCTMSVTMEKWAR